MFSAISGSGGPLHSSLSDKAVQSNRAQMAKATIAIERESGPSIALILTSPSGTSWIDRVEG